METKLKYEFKVTLASGTVYTMVAYGDTPEEAKKNVMKDLLELVEKFK